jgi:hypothetical protein
MPAVLLGALNDRLLLVNPTDINPRQKKAVEIRSCLVGLLEPLLIGFATMQQHFAQKIDLSEVLYQITSRYFFCWIAVVTFQYASELLSLWHLALMHCHVVVYVLCYHFELSTYFLIVLFCWMSML